MQMFDDLEHTSWSLNACIYYQIAVSVSQIIKKDLMMEDYLKKHLVIDQEGLTSHYRTRVGEYYNYLG